MYIHPFQIKESFISLQNKILRNINSTIMTQEDIIRRIANVKEQFPDVVFRCQELDNGSFVCIMRGGLMQDNPSDYMDNAVSLFVNHELHNEFIEKFLDNPWVRIIIFDFNNIYLK